MLYYTSTGISFTKPSSAVKWSVSLKCDSETVVLLSGSATRSTHQFPKPEVVYYAPLLKSALQKAIRRRLTDQAIAIAYQFLRQEPVEFLRRLPIYMMEDTYLQPTAAIRAVWLMCAVSKGWKLTTDDVQFLLDTVKTLCDLDQHELLDTSPAPPLFSRIKTIIEPLSEIQAAVAAIWIRSEFGGMKGDMAFLLNACHTWLDREADGFVIEETIQSENVPIPSASQTSNLYLLEGVDFHCYPRLLQSLRAAGLRTEMTEEEFKYVLWHSQSGLNTRDWLFETAETAKKTAEKMQLYAENAPRVDSLKPYLIAFAKKAWIPSKPQKTMDDYFRPLNLENYHNLEPSLE